MEIQNLKIHTVLKSQTFRGRVLREKKVELVKRPLCLAVCASIIMEFSCYTKKIPQISYCQE